MSDGFDWYVLKVLSGAENAVLNSILADVKFNKLSDCLQDHSIPNIEIPSTSGKNKIKRVYPGYLFLKLKMNERLFEIIQKTPRVYNFLSSMGKPKKMKQEELEKLYCSVERASSSKTLSVELAIGDTVEIMSGSFQGFRGAISGINSESEYNVIISVFGRETNISVPKKDLKKDK